ncbi:MAG: O-antigen ligase family protein [Pseudomonadota bacterium]
MSLTLFVIFCLISCFLIIKDPFWGTVIYLVAVFFRFQDYLPQLEGFPLALLILLLTTIVGFAKGAFAGIGLSNISLVVLLYVIVIGIAPLLQGIEVTRYSEHLGKAYYALLLVALIRSKEKMELYGFALFGTILFLAFMLFKAYYYGGSDYIYWRENRPYGQGLLENPNAIVVWLNYGVIFASFLFVTTAKLYMKGVYSVCILFLLYDNMLCMSRGGTIGLALAVFLLFFFLKGKERIIILLALTVIGVFVFQRGNIHYYTRMSQMAGETETGEIEGSAGERLNSWANGLDIIKSNLFFGVGANNIMQHNFRVNSDGSLEGRALHNGYLEIFAENGIFGAGLWLLILLLSCLNLFSYRRIGKVGEKNMVFTKWNKIFLCCYGPLGASLMFGSKQYTVFIFILAGVSAVLKKLNDVEISSKRPLFRR